MIRSLCCLLVLCCCCCCCCDFIRKLVEIGWKTIEEQFLSNVEWRAKFLKGGDAADFDIESIRPHVIMGMNFPVSVCWFEFAYETTGTMCGGVFSCTIHTYNIHTCYMHGLACIHTHMHTSMHVVVKLLPPRLVILCFAFLCRTQPSQYQLHLQVILPPFMPVHWDMFKKGVHFTKGRFVPVEFILPALELQQPVPDAANKSVLCCGWLKTVFRDLQHARKAALH